jgi:hypothetical protein
MINDDDDYDDDGGGGGGGDEVLKVVTALNCNKFNKKNKF